jgi:hypothetical protein
MMAIKLATLAGNFMKRFLEGIFFWYIDGSQSSFLQLCCLQLFKTDLARFFFLVSHDGNNCPWEIVGMDLVTDLTKSSEFHLTNAMDSCLPSEIAHVSSCHENSTLLTKPWLSLLIIVVDFMMFYTSLCLNDNPALLAKFGNLLWGNWIPNS